VSRRGPREPGPRDPPRGSRWGRSGGATTAVSVAVTAESGAGFSVLMRYLEF